MSSWRVNPLIPPVQREQPAEVIPISTSVSHSNVPKSILQKPKTMDKHRKENVKPVVTAENVHRDGQTLKKWFKVNDIQKRILTEKLNHSQQTIKQLSIQLNDCQVKKEKLLIQIKDKEKESGKYEDEFKAVEATCNKVKEELMMYDQKLQACEQLKEEIKNFNEDQLMKIKNLTTEFGKLELSSAMKFVEQEHQIANLQMEKQRSEANYKMQNEDLHNTIDMLKIELSQSQIQVVDLIAESEQVNNSLSSLTEERDGLQSDANELKQNLAALTELFRNFKAESSEEISLKEDEIRKLKEETENLKCEIESQKQKAEELLATVETKNSEVVMMKQEIDTLKDNGQKTEELMAKQTELKSEVKKLEEKSKDYKLLGLKAVKKYEKLKKVTEKELALRSKDNKDLRHQIDNLYFDIQKETEEKTKLSEQCEALRQEMTTALEAYKAEYHTIVLEKEAQICSLNAKLTEGVNEMDQIIKKNNEDVHQLKTDFEKTKAILLSQKDSVEQKLIVVEKQVSELQNQLNSKNDEIKLLKKPQDDSPKQPVVKGSSLKKSKMTDTKKSVTFKDSETNYVSPVSTDTSNEYVDLETFLNAPIKVSTPSNRVALRSKSTKVVDTSIETPVIKTSPFSIDLKRTYTRNSSGNEVGNVKKLRQAEGKGSEDAVRSKSNDSSKENFSEGKEAHDKSQTAESAVSKVAGPKRFFKFSPASQHVQTPKVAKKSANRKEQSLDLDQMYNFPG